MAITTQQVTVGTAATELTSTDRGGRDGSRILVTPSADVFVGNAQVTASNGYRVAAGGTFSDDLGVGERLYAVVASGTATVSVYQGDI